MLYSSLSKVLYLRIHSLRLESFFTTRTAFQTSSKYLEENPEVAQEIQLLVRQKLETGAIVSANSVTAHGNDEAAEEMMAQTDASLFN